MTSAVCSVIESFPYLHFILGLFPIFAYCASEGKSILSANQINKFTLLQA